MKKILLTYGTTEGQTAKIADFISDVLRGHGHDVTTLDVKDTPDTIPAGFDAVIVGASIHMGKHDRCALLYTQYGFIKRRMMKKIAGDKPGELGTDTSRDYVYTERDGVKRFAEHVAADLDAAPA